MHVDLPHFFPKRGVAIGESGEVSQACVVNENVEVIERDEGFLDLGGIAKITSEWGDSFWKKFDRPAEPDDFHP